MPYFIPLDGRYRSNCRFKGSNNRAVSIFDSFKRIFNKARACYVVIKYRYRGARCRQASSVRRDAAAAPISAVSTCDPRTHNDISPRRRYFKATSSRVAQSGVTSTVGKGVAAFPLPPGRFRDEPSHIVSSSHRLCLPVHRPRASSPSSSLLPLMPETLEKQ